VTLIDFEQSGTGRFILDLGIALSGSCLNHDNTDLSLDLMKSFLRGYEQSRPLLIIEKEYLRDAIAVGFFSISLWRIKRFYEGQLDQRKKYNYRELLERCRSFWSSSAKDDFNLFE
jgi:homoserine kinase type II